MERVRGGISFPPMPQVVNVYVCVLLCGWRGEVLAMTLWINHHGDSVERMIDNQLDNIMKIYFLTHHRVYYYYLTKGMAERSVV